jgi:hypothetical protein
MRVAQTRACCVFDMEKPSEREGYELGNFMLDRWGRSVKQVESPPGR